MLFVAETFLTSRPLSGSRKTGGPLFLSVLFLICRPFFECFFPQKASVSSYCVVPCSWVDIVIRAYQGIINLVVGSIILYKHGKRLLCFVCFHVWTLVAHAAAEPCRSEWLRKDSATSENKSGRYVKTSTDGWLGWWVGGWVGGGVSRCADGGCNPRVVFVSRINVMEMLGVGSREAGGVEEVLAPTLCQCERYCRVGKGGGGGEGGLRYRSLFAPA